jgi:predicted transcriptional regulator
MKDEHYINIQGWMINHLDLKPLQLILFALIFGFSQDDESEFKGSLKYMERALRVTRPTLTKALSELVEKGLIVKRTEWVSGVSFNRYKHSWEGVKKLYMTGKETLHVTGKESLHYNNSNNNKSNNSKGTLFPEEDLEKEFQQSIVFDFEKFESKLSEQKKLGVDLQYYYHAVNDWSEGLPKKDKRKYKTERGWIAQARTFMRRDNESSKLKMMDSATKKMEQQENIINFMKDYD